MRHIRYLVFKGGGVLGIAYAGAIKSLHDHKLLENIEGVAGTSAGSIVATLLSLRYTAEEVKNIVSNTQFKKFEDHWDPLRIPTKYGLYRGAYFLDWIKEIIKNKTENENITFSELASLGCRDLKVFATDLNTHSIKEFSKDKTPNVLVAESIRASMSIPLFFEAWKFSDKNPDDHVYVDGGTVYNYPITAFDNLNTTLGFFLYTKQKQSSYLNIDNFHSYAHNLFKTLMEAQDIDFEKDELQVNSTVLIDDFGISSTNFNITKSMEEQLYASGLSATNDYIKKWMEN